MSVTLTKSEGVTILTMDYDPQSRWPPLCQLLKNLCCSLVCFSVSEHLRTVQRCCLSVLGTIQIMVGLLNIGLSVLFIVIDPGTWFMDRYSFPFWLGGLFILFGIMCILSERFSSPCLVILNVILNLVGVGFALAAIILYTINMGYTSRWDRCYYYNPYSRRGTGVTPSPQDMYMNQKCIESTYMVLMILRSIKAMLIILSVLEVAVHLISAVLGIKALTEKEPEKSSLNAEL